MKKMLKKSTLGKQLAGENLEGKKEAYAELKKEGGLRFISAMGNSFTGIKFIVKDKNGNQHIVRAADDTVFNNLMNNLTLPELREMENYKDEVRALIPETSIKGTDFKYGEYESEDAGGRIISSPYMYKEKKWRTNSFY